MLNAYAVLDPIETLYIASLLAEHRRPIDRYIDYFGGRRADPGAWSSSAGLADREEA